MDRTNAVLCLARQPSDEVDEHRSRPPLRDDDILHEQCVYILLISSRERALAPATCARRPGSVAGASACATLRRRQGLVLGSPCGRPLAATVQPLERLQTKCLGQVCGAAARVRREGIGRFQAETALIARSFYLMENSYEFLPHWMDQRLLQYPDEAALGCPCLPKRNVFNWIYKPEKWQRLIGRLRARLPFTV